MNLNQLWAGEDYAYFSNRGRGENYRPGAVRVRVRRAYQQQLPGNERMSGFARVDMFQDDGVTPKLNYFTDEPLVNQEVRARDIAMRWDEYVDERDHREAERERRTREAEEAARKEEEDKENLATMMVIKWGIPRNAINSISYGSVSLNRAILEGVLGINHEQVT
jgi:hypothetical protein